MGIGDMVGFGMLVVPVVVLFVAFVWLFIAEAIDDEGWSSCLITIGVFVYIAIAIWLINLPEG